MEKSWFFNAEVDQEGHYDREYLAEDFARYFSQFISNGVFPNPSTGLQVVESSPPGMSVVLNPGNAFINGYGYENTGPLTFPIDVASGSLDRKDAVFIRFDKNRREIKARVQKGTNSVSASAPTLIRTSDYWDLCVAELDVKAGTTRITQNLIIDKRLDTLVCGIVINAVQSIDTHTLYLQVQKDLESFRNVSQAEWDSWFDGIKHQLGQSPVGNLQQQVDNLKTSLSRTDSTVSRVEQTANSASTTANSAYQKANSAEQAANTADQKARAAQQTANDAKDVASVAMPRTGGAFSGVITASTAPRSIRYDQGELVNVSIREPSNLDAATSNLLVFVRR